MDVWLIALYGAAAVFALRALSTLMTAHRRKLYREHEAREYARLQEEARLEAEAAAAAKKKKNRRTPAA
jgi:hypothetical protein